MGGGGFGGGGALEEFDSHKTHGSIILVVIWEKQLFLLLFQSETQTDYSLKLDIF